MIKAARNVAASAMAWTLYHAPGLEGPYAHAAAAARRVPGLHTLFRETTDRLASRLVGAQVSMWLDLPHYHAYGMRMATRINITVPDDIARAGKAAGLNFSALAAQAVAAELERRVKTESMIAYLDELDAELGPVSAEDQAAADAWVAGLTAPPAGTVKRKSA